ncbi:MAG: HD domain-containing protein [Dehalococcoidia bacterium]|nr:HD domain-containing protein [Dehalococcoidia bacterium]
MPRPPRSGTYVVHTPAASGDREGEAEAMERDTVTRSPDTQTFGALAIASPFRSRELRVRPARRIDLVAHFAGAFDLAEGQEPGHAARVAYLGHRVAEELGMGAEERSSVLHVGLLHASGVSPALDAEDVEANAWVAEQFGLSEVVREAARAVGEHWDGRGEPLGRAGTDVPLEALCVSAAHWACEYSDRVDHPLRARAALQRADSAELVPLVGPQVADALYEVLRDDETWLALFSDEPATMVARLGIGEGKPSRRRVEDATAAMGVVIDASVREAGRAVRVSTLARALAGFIGYSEGARDAIALAGHVLDIGQLGVPSRVLDKPSILTVEEMELMRRHPGMGARLLEGIPGFEEITTWVEQHHERPDGRGYPEMLGEDELTMPARILAVADAYWALRAHRPYRPSHTDEETQEILRAGAGRQFDADVVAVLPEALVSAEDVLAQGGASEDGGGDEAG